MAEEELILFECRMVLVPNIRDDKNKTENDLLEEINTFEQLPCMKICGRTPPQPPPPPPTVYSRAKNKSVANFALFLITLVLV